MKRSIKEISTSGMCLYEREKLIEEYEMIPIGSIVYKAGDAWTYTEVVIVNDENQKTISMFWNSLYFDNHIDADLKTSIAHAEYNDYQERAIKGIDMAWY